MIFLSNLVHYHAHFCHLDLSSKSEYVIYKLKEMGKVSDKDVLQICETFDKIDSGNCGKITLADLMEAHY